MSKRIFLEKNDLEKFYKELGSGHFELQTKVSREYGEQKIGVYFKLIDFTYQIVTVIGVIAGFGFTAISVVEKSFFVAGEGFLLSGILWGIFLVHQLYSSELTSLQKASDTHQKHFRERNKIFSRIWTELNSPLGASQLDLQNLVKVDTDTVKLFATEEDQGTDWIEKIKSYQRIMLYFLMGGSISILVSILAK